MGKKVGLRRLAKETGLSVGEIAAAQGIPLYSQRVAQGLKPRAKKRLGGNGKKESMPSHLTPKKVEGTKRIVPKGTPGTYRAILTALGKEQDVEVKAPVPFARRNKIRMLRISRAAKKRAAKNKARKNKQH